MQSAEDHTQQSCAQSLSKTFDHKENNGSSPVARVRDAQPRRAFAALGAARDAVEEPQREIIELSDGERAELLAYLAEEAATKPTALKVDQDPSDRKQRAAARAKARGHEEVDVDAHTAAALRCAYAPPARICMAGTGATYPKRECDWVYLAHEDQRKRTIEILESLGYLDVSDEVINNVSRLYFDNRDKLGHLECCNDMREAALTRASWNRLINKILNYMKAYDPDRAGPEPAHGPILRQMFAELQKLGITTSGSVEGKLAGLGVRGVYSNCHMSGGKAELSAASSLFHKLWIVTATRDKLDPIIKQTVDCSFGNATANSGEIGTLRSDKHGTFRAAKRGLAPLCKRYVDPRLAKVANESFLGHGRLPRGTKLLIGNFGKDVIGHAIQCGRFGKYARCPSRRCFNLRRDGVGSASSTWRGPPKLASRERRFATTSRLVHAVPMHRRRRPRLFEVAALEHLLLREQAQQMDERRLRCGRCGFTKDVSCGRRGPRLFGRERAAGRFSREYAHGDARGEADPRPNDPYVLQRRHWRFAFDEVV